MNYWGEKDGYFKALERIDEAMKNCFKYQFDDDVIPEYFQQFNYTEYYKYLTAKHQRQLHASAPAPAAVFDAPAPAPAPAPVDEAGDAPASAPTVKALLFRADAPSVKMVKIPVVNTPVGEMLNRNIVKDLLGFSGLEGLEVYGYGDYRFIMDDGMWGAFKLEPFKLEPTGNYLVYKEKNYHMIDIEEDLKIVRDEVKIVHDELKALTE